MKNFYFRLFIATLIVVVIYAALFIWVDRYVAYVVLPLLDGPLYKIGLVYQYVGEPALWIALSFLGLCIIAWRRASGKGSAQLDKLALVCASTFLAGIIAEILKVVLARYRPIELLLHNQYGFHFFSMKYFFNSTPSGHATIIFAIATSLSLLFRRYAVLFFLFAFLAACSRVIMDQHFVSDVVLGAYIGIISPLLINAYFKKWSNCSQY